MIQVSYRGRRTKRQPSYVNRPKAGVQYSTQEARDRYAGFMAVLGTC